jgi:signal-transduction protein with cAMP-binding, CBS, and nucleotidyltransferase domain
VRREEPFTTVAAILKVKGSHVETRPETTVMISERDLVRALIEHGTHLLALPVSKMMTTPVPTCTPHDRVTAVMARMTRHRVRHLPVVDGGKLAGIVSIGDAVKYRLDQLELEANILRETLMVSH